MESSKSPKFCAKNLKRLFEEERYDLIVRGMRPMIKNMARKFAATPSARSVLSLEDYEQEGALSVMIVINSFRFEKEDPEANWARFLFLCQAKTTTRMIRLQRGASSPVTVPGRVQDLSRSLFRDDNMDKSPEQVAAIYNVTESMARGALLATTIRSGKDEWVEYAPKNANRTSGYLDEAETPYAPESGLVSVGGVETIDSKVSDSGSTVARVFAREIESFLGKEDFESLMDYIHGYKVKGGRNALRKVRRHVLG